MYNQVLRGCARYLGLTDPRVIGQMTVREYNEMMRAVAYKHVDEEFRLKVLAWDINQAGAMKSKAGGGTEPVFTTFQDFYDYDETIKAIDHPKGSENSLAARMARYYKDRDRKE